MNGRPAVEKICDGTDSPNDSVSGPHVVNLKWPTLLIVDDTIGKSHLRIWLSIFYSRQFVTFRSVGISNYIQIYITLITHPGRVNVLVTFCRHGASDC